MPESITNSSVVQALGVAVVFVFGLLLGLGKWISLRFAGKVDALEQSIQNHSRRIDKLNSSHEITTMSVTTLRENLSLSERRHKEHIESHKRETDRRLAYLEQRDEQIRGYLDALFNKQTDAIERILKDK